MRRATDHFAKNQPMRIKRRIPFQRISRFVPKLNPLKKFAEAGDEYVEKISVLFRIAWRRTFTGRNSKTGWSVMKTWQDVHFLCESRQQPLIPFLAALGVPVGPRNTSTQISYTDCLEIAEQEFDAFLFTWAKPLQDAENGMAAAFHTASPRALSSRTAWSIRSTAIWPSNQPASSTNPSLRL